MACVGGGGGRWVQSCGKSPRETGGSRRLWSLIREGFVCLEGGMQKRSIKLQQIKTYVSFQHRVPSLLFRLSTWGPQIG